MWLHIDCLHVSGMAPGASSAALRHPRIKMWHASQHIRYPLSKHSHRYAYRITIPATVIRFPDCLHGEVAIRRLTKLKAMWPRGWMRRPPPICHGLINGREELNLTITGNVKFANNRLDCTWKIYNKCQFKYFSHPSLS